MVTEQETQMFSYFLGNLGNYKPKRAINEDLVTRFRDPFALTVCVAETHFGYTP
jgi:uncharacterized protein YlxP (DUF503 family)